MTILKSKTSVTVWYKKNPVIFFVGLFTLQMIVFYLLYYNPWFIDHVLSQLVNVYAKISSQLLNIMGFDTAVTGEIISSPHFSVGIKKGCDAMEPMALFVSGIMAFPAEWKKKFIGLSTGLLILFLLNIVRIVLLFITGVKFPDLFEAMHMEVLQVVFIIVTIGLWYLWLRWSLRKTQPS